MCGPLLIKKKVLLPINYIKKTLDDDLMLINIERAKAMKIINKVANKLFIAGTS